MSRAGADTFAHDFLADLHAGVIDDSIADAVRPRVLADPAAVAYLESLDRVVLTLQERGADHAAGTAMPQHVQDRLDAALAGAADVAPTPEPTRRFPTRVLAAAAAAVIVAGAGASVFAAVDRPAPPTVEAQPADPVLDTRMIMGTVGEDDPGRLADPMLLSGCLAANGIARDATVLGIGTVQITPGRDSTLVVVAGSTPGALIALAVGDSCGPGTADTVSRVAIG